MRIRSLQAHVPFALVALLGAILVVRYFSQQPGFTDAYYHYNAAAQFASGNGLTDHYLWTFIGAPDSLPAPSHLYWMPGTSLVIAVSMALFGVTYAAAQIGLIVTLWGAALIAYWLGGYVGHTMRHRWLAGLLLLIGGFYMRFWGQTDTFAPYALFGALALVFMGRAATATQPKTTYLMWALAGACTAAGHLIRSDGLLLLLVGWIVIFYPQRQPENAPYVRRVLPAFAMFTAVYLLVMLPWFVRNLQAIGTPLPTGGTQALWYTRYDDLFNYPQDANPQTFFADGIDLLLTSRWDAFSQNLGTLVAVEGAIIFTPFMLLALWRRRRDPFWRGVIWFAIGIHAAFTLAFPMPGVNGGLLHAAAALMPFWFVLGIIGIDETVDWIAKRRRNWRPTIAKPLFTFGALIAVTWLGLTISLPRIVPTYTPDLYRALDAYLPPDARVMINDPSMLYYFTGRGGTTFPNEAPETILTLARQYDLDYVLVEIVGDGLVAVPYNMTLDLDAPPPFLRLIEPDVFPIGGVRLYAIDAN